MGSDGTARRDRLLNRLLGQGEQALSDRELLELLLLYENKPAAANEILDEIERIYGSTAAFFDAVGASDRPMPGLTDATLLLLRAIPSLCRRALIGTDKTGVVVRDTLHAQQLLRPYFVGYTRESVVVLPLDAGNRALDFIRLHTGSGNEVVLRLQDILDAVLPLHAKRLILAHAHPGGESEPSATDLVVTKKLIEDLRDYGIDVLDHLVFSRNDCTSMATAAPKGMLRFAPYKWA